MFEAVYQFFGFGEKPPQTEPSPETTPLSDHPKNFSNEASKCIENIALPIPSATHSMSLDGSSDEYEDVRARSFAQYWTLTSHQETYTFAADVKDSKNKKRSIMAFHNPSSPENHISRGFATDLGFPIPEPPDNPSVEVSWSSSSLQRLNETTRFMVAKSESFKLLFGREDKMQWHRASIKQHSYGGKDKMAQFRPISFREGTKSGILWPLELADSDSLESGSGRRGPKVADVEARLQSDHSFASSSLLERYFEQAEDGDSTTNAWETAHIHRTRGPESWKHGQQYVPPRKPATAIQASATPSANPYAVLRSLNSDSSNTSSSKKQKKKRKGPKKLNQLAERKVERDQLPINYVDDVTTARGKIASTYNTPIPLYDSGSDVNIISHLYLDTSSESGQTPSVFSSAVGTSTHALSTSPEDNYTASTFPKVRSITSGFGGKEYHGQGEERIPRSSKNFEGEFEENQEAELQPEIQFTLPLGQGVEIAQDAGGAGHEDPKQSPQIQGQLKKKTGSRRRHAGR
jgi:hypothetical protein